VLPDEQRLERPFDDGPGAWLGDAESFQAVVSLDMDEQGRAARRRVADRSVLVRRQVGGVRVGCRQVGDAHGASSVTARRTATEESMPAWARDHRPNGPF